MLIVAICLHSFYIVVSYLGGIVPWPHLCIPLADIRNRVKKRSIFLEIIMFLEQKLKEPKQIQSEDLFLEIAMFLGPKLDKIGTNSKW